MTGRFPALLGVGALLALASGCAADDLELLVPVDVELLWDASFDAMDDGLAAAIPIDVMVYRQESGVPVDGVEIELRADTLGVIPLRGDALEVVDSGACDDCGAVVWDAYRDLYVAFDPDEGAGDALRLHTDPMGIARAYLFVDSLGADGTLEPAQVTVSVVDEDRAEAFLVVPR